MKWFTIRTYEYRKKSRECWHLWFAWRPITVYIYPDGAERRTWLEAVLRKGTLYHNWYVYKWIWEYRSR